MNTLRLVLMLAIFFAQMSVGGQWRVEMRPLPGIGDPAVKLRDLTMGSDGSLWWSGGTFNPGLYRTEPDGKGPVLVLEERGQPFYTVVPSGPEEVAVVEGSNAVAFFSEPRPARQFRTDGVGLASGVAIRDEWLYSTGGFIEGECCDDLSRNEWRQKNRRRDCVLVRQSLEDAAAPPEPLFCDERLAHPETAALMPMGDVLISADGKRVYAVVERWPALITANLMTGKSKGVPISGAEREPARLSSADFSARLDPQAMQRVRARRPWPVGLLNAPEGNVAIVYVVTDASRAHLRLALYDREGELLETDVPIGISGTKGLAAIPVSNPSGGDPLMLVLEPTGGGRTQRLYQVVFHRGK